MDTNALKKRKISKEGIFALCVAIIPLVGFVLFQLFPIGLVFSTMFVDMVGFNLDTMQWNNFANFKEVFSDAKFYHSLKVSVVLTLPHFFGLVISLFISALITQKLKGHKVFKVIFFIPYVCSSVAVAIMWKWLFDPNFGIINSVLEGVFGAESAVKWFSDPKAYTIMLLIVMTWQTPCYGIVMFCAALTSVNKALYEAAEIDGATKIRQFFAISLPAISPTTFYLLSAGIIAGLQTFDLAHIFAGDAWTGSAGPKDAALTTVLYIYNTGINFSRMPQASLMSFVLFLIIFTVMLLNFKLSKKWVSYD